MKLHASVGADILSAIEFPYPVVPIVRHHHENWDGSGYPAGLKGTDIPIGARILSVVDCFDALTSDRPYRPRLSDDEALKILAERRGKMYDPLIVDAFTAVYSEIAPEAEATKLSRDVFGGLNASTTSGAAPRSPGLDNIAAGADEMLTLYELARALAAHAGVAETGDVLANHLRRLVPFTQSILFLYDSSSDELEAKHALGQASSVVRGLRIPVGQRLSGWVAANRQTIVNSDPILDLGDIVRSWTPRLRSCLSTAIVCDSELIGVLSLYSEKSDAFNEDHRRVIEVVARQVSQAFKGLVESDSSSNHYVVNALPNVQELEKLLAAIDSSRTTSITLLFLDVVNLQHLDVTHGRPVRDEILGHVVRHATIGLRTEDLLFRSANDEFVALLSDTDMATATSVAKRIEDSIRRDAIVLRDGAILNVRIDTSCVSRPRDGRSVNDLIASARVNIAIRRGFVTRIH